MASNNSTNQTASEWCFSVLCQPQVPFCALGDPCASEADATQWIGSADLVVIVIVTTAMHRWLTHWRAVRRLYAAPPAPAQQNDASVDVSAEQIALLPQRTLEQAIAIGCATVLGDDPRTCPGGIRVFWGPGAEREVKANWFDKGGVELFKQEHLKWHRGDAQGVRRRKGLSESQFDAVCALLQDGSSEQGREYTAGIERKVYAVEHREELEQQYEEEAITAARKAVPSWSELPDGVTVRAAQFEEGEEQQNGAKFMRRVFLSGAGSADVVPNTVVVEKNRYEGARGFMLRMADAGVHPRIYSWEDGYRVVEFSQGTRPLFSGSPIFFAMVWTSGRCWFWLIWVWLGYFVQCLLLQVVRPLLLACNPDLPKVQFDIRAHRPDAGWCFGTRAPAEHSPKDAVAMATLGKAIGTIHAEPITWYNTAHGVEAFESDSKWPRLVDTPDSAVVESGFRMWWPDGMNGLSRGVKPNRVLAAVPILAFVIVAIVKVVSAAVEGLPVVPSLLASHTLMLLLLLVVKNEYVRSHAIGRLVTAARRVAMSPVLPRRGLFAEPVTAHWDLQPLNLLITEDRTRVDIIDWDGLKLAHRGSDIAYFLCMSGAIHPLEARTSFARAYLEAHGSPPTEAEVDKLLWDIECSMPLALVSLAGFHCHLGLDWNTPILTTVAERALALLESAAGDPRARRRLVERGVANAAMGLGFSPVDRFWALGL